MARDCLPARRVCELRARAFNQAKQENPGSAPKSTAKQAPASELLRQKKAVIAERE